VALSSALLSSANQSPGSARSGLKGALLGAVFSEESAIGAGHAEAEAQALALAAATADGLALGFGPGVAWTTADGAGFCGAAWCVRQATASVNNRPQRSATDRGGSSFNADITLERLTA
jgi:hypothetical protein